MTEKHKMLSGLAYTSTDINLVHDRVQCRRWLRDFNAVCGVSVTMSKEYFTVLSEFMPNVHLSAIIEPTFRCDYGYNLHIGTGVFINFDCVILDAMPVYIGANTMIGPGTHIYASTHPNDHMQRRSGAAVAKSVHIGSDCWIGGGCIILPGVTIGDRAIVAAGTVVSKHVPPDTMIMTTKTIERTIH